MAAEIAAEMVEPAPETVTDSETLAAAEADFADSIELAEPEPIELPISLDLAAPEEEEAQALAARFGKQYVDP